MLALKFWNWNEVLTAPCLKATDSDLSHVPVSIAISHWFFTETRHIYHFSDGIYLPITYFLAGDFLSFLRGMLSQSLIFPT